MSVFVHIHLWNITVGWHVDYGMLAMICSMNEGRRHDILMFKILHLILMTSESITPLNEWFTCMALSGCTRIIPMPVAIYVKHPEHYQNAKGDENSNVIISYVNKKPSA